MKSLDNFEVYQKAVLLLGLVTELLERLPTGNCVAIKLCDRAQVETEKKLAREIVAMLTALTNFRT